MAEHHGLDVVLPMTEWCRANISARDGRFYFHHADVSNTLYAGGKTDAASYVFPFGGGTFDVVFAASVLTHLVPASPEQYAREIHRVLKPSGSALVMFFLVNDEWRQKITRGDELLVNFQFQREGYRTASPECPEASLPPNKMTRYACFRRPGCGSKRFAPAHGCGVAVRG